MKEFYQEFSFQEHKLTYNVTCLIRYDDDSHHFLICGGEKIAHAPEHAEPLDEEEFLFTMKRVSPYVDTLVDDLRKECAFPT